MSTSHRELVETICAEIAAAAGAIDAAAVEQAIAAVTAAPRVFVHGEGRSGLALRMGAMRLVHLGKMVHIVGDATTPAIGRGDLLVAASASGETAITVLVAEQARSAGASLLAVTATAGGSLATLADLALILPTPSKAGSAGGSSAQPGGSLFEQCLLILLDSLFLQMAGDSAAEHIARRHANLE